MNDYEMVILQRQRQRELIRDRDSVMVARSVEQPADPCAPSVWSQVKNWVQSMMPKHVHTMPNPRPCPDLSTD